MRIRHFVHQDHPAEVVYVGDDQHAERDHQDALPQLAAIDHVCAERHADDDRADHRDQSAYGGDECPENDVVHAQQPVDQAGRERLRQHDDRDAERVAEDDRLDFLLEQTEALALEGHVGVDVPLHFATLEQHEVEDDEHHEYVCREAVGRVDQRRYHFRQESSRVLEQILGDGFETDQFVQPDHLLFEKADDFRRVDVGNLGRNHFVDQKAESQQQDRRA